MYEENMNVVELKEKIANVSVSGVSPKVVSIAWNNIVNKYY